jgi:hypothetical protein
MRVTNAIALDFSVCAHAICFAGESWRVVRKNEESKGGASALHFFRRSNSNVRKVCSSPHYSFRDDLVRREFRIVMKSKPSG